MDVMSLTKKREYSLTKKVDTLNLAKSWTQLILQKKCRLWYRQLKGVKMYC